VFFAQMKSLDKKTASFEGAAPRSGCSSPSLSLASTCSPSPEPEADVSTSSHLVQMDAQITTNTDNVRISLSLSPDMWQQIDSGGQVRFELHMNHVCDSTEEHHEWQSDTPATTLATTTSTNGMWSASDPPTDLHQSLPPTHSCAPGDDLAMSDEELIAMLAGCAAPAKDSVYEAGHASDEVLDHSSSMLCLDDDIAGAQHLDAFENVEDEHSLIADSDSHDEHLLIDDSHDRLWSEDLLGIC